MGNIFSGPGVAYWPGIRQFFKIHHPNIRITDEMRELAITMIRERIAVEPDVLVARDFLVTIDARLKELAGDREEPGWDDDMSGLRGFGLRAS